MEDTEVDVLSDNETENDSSPEQEESQLGEKSEEIKENSLIPRRLRLPQARIRHMMKKDTYCGNLASDAVFLLTKATEMFIEFMAKESYKQIPKGKRKTVLLRDVVQATEGISYLCFLDGVIE